MTKVLLTSTCGECGKYRWVKHGAHEYMCSNTKRASTVLAVDPASPAPDGCPLLDLDAVLDKVKENCMYDVNYLGGSACRVWKAAIEAARAELKGGGD